MARISRQTKKPTHPKYIFVVGGVMSSVGKGIVAASVGRILIDKGFSVTALKIDPYINVDAGTMNPTEHGEVFVTNDGDETDQDIGNYERFLNTDILSTNYMTTGRVYLSVIEKERALEYKGKCVQVVPHIPIEIIRRIEEAQKNANADVVVIEIGGTVGEYENILFIEALRLLKSKIPHDVITAMVSYLPIPSKVGEMKTKPTQHAVRTLNSTGIFPDFLFCRAAQTLDAVRKEKLSLFCNIKPDNIIAAPDVDSIYDIPANFEKQKLGDRLCKELGLIPKKKKTSSPWTSFTQKLGRANGTVSIAVVGKYFETGEFVLSDSYLSVIEAIKYSAYAQGKKPVLTWVNALDFERDPKTLKSLSVFDGILVPGGFGARGVEGKLKAIEYARTHAIPYFGLCYGMQLAVIEYARNVLGWKDATTREINSNSKHIMIDIMDSQRENLKKAHYGGSMRLGAYPAVLADGTHARKAYGTKTISERHRHRYEVNPVFIPDLKTKGLVFSGMSPDGNLAEIVELPSSVHPFFVATQFHPEFKARPLDPHPLFSAFIKAAISHKKM